MIKIHRSVLCLKSALGLLMGLSISACQPMTTSNGNANSNSNANASANSNASSSSSETGSTSGVAINTREPDKYSATLTFSLETEGGEKAIGIASLSVQVARNGDDRRLEFKLPDGTPLVYLDHNNHHYAIVPGRKQYAELTQEATGIQMHKLLTPGQLVEDLKGVKGVERAGEEVMNGRTADKYRYGASTNTNTKAGEVKAEAFVYVDKETGLPLRAELGQKKSRRAQRQAIPEPQRPRAASRSFGGQHSAERSEPWSLGGPAERQSARGGVRPVGSRNRPARAPAPPAKVGSILERPRVGHASLQVP